MERIEIFIYYSWSIKMQVLVMYYSRSGNTKTLAEEIGKGVEQVEGVSALIKSVSEITKDDFVNSAGIIAGSPVYFGVMAAELKQIFDKFVGVRKKMGDKVGAAFTTSANPTGGKETTMFSIIQAMMIYGMVIVGDPLDATGHYGIACTGKPDQDTIINAHKLGCRVARLAKKIHD
jgi:NAD(P)H dehydrogenase (quinone)